MVKMEKIEFIRLPDARVIGFELAVDMIPGSENPIPAFWDEHVNNGDMEALKKFPLAMEDCTVGWMGDMTQKSFNYIAGVLAKKDTPVPEGMSYRDLTSCDLAKAYIYGDLQNGEIYANAHALTVGGIESNDKKPDYKPGWSAEVYPNDVDFYAKEGTLCYVIPYK